MSSSAAFHTSFVPSSTFPSFHPPPNHRPIPSQNEISRNMRCCCRFFQFSPRRPPSLLLLLLPFLLLLLLLHRFFRPASTASPLPQCPDQPLALLYQLHSLASAPVPAPTPLNWLSLQLSSRPSSHHRHFCPLPSVGPFSRLLPIVHSRLDHFAQRHSLRRQFRRHRLVPIFVLSSGNASREEAAQMRREAEMEGDLLVLANVPEEYRLLSHKTRAWVQWLAKGNGEAEAKCRRRPHFVLKMDDDVLVNWPALGRLLARLERVPKSTRERLVLCRTIRAGQISRNPASKWYLSPVEFRPSPGGLGLYCQGLALLLSWDLLGVAADNLRRVQFLWMDDWYLTHALLAGSNATFVDIAPSVRNVEDRQNGGSAGEKSIRRNGGPAIGVHYPPIFGHFRPAEEFPEKRKLSEWAKMMAAAEENGREKATTSNAGGWCTL